MRVPEDVVFRLLGKTGKEQSERLRRAVADPSAVVVAWAGLKGETGSVHENERDLRLQRFGDVLIADDNPWRANLISPRLPHVPLKRAKCNVPPRRDIAAHWSGEHDHHALARRQRE